MNLRNIAKRIASKRGGTVNFTFYLDDDAEYSGEADFSPPDPSVGVMQGELDVHTIISPDGNEIPDVQGFLDQHGATVEQAAIDAMEAEEDREEALRENAWEAEAEARRERSRGL